MKVTSVHSSGGSSKDAIRVRGANSTGEGEVGVLETVLLGEESDVVSLVAEGVHAARRNEPVSAKHVANCVTTRTSWLRHHDLARGSNARLVEGIGGATWWFRGEEVGSWRHTLSRSSSSAMETLTSPKACVDRSAGFGDAYSRLLARRRRSHVKRRHFFCLDVSEGPSRLPFGVLAGRGHPIDLDLGGCCVGRPTSLQRLVEATIDEGLWFETVGMDHTLSGRVGSMLSQTSGTEPPSNVYASPKTSSRRCR